MFWNNIFLLAVVFVLTYDPNSRMIEKFIGQPTTPVGGSQRHQQQQQQQRGVGREYETGHYNALQFGQEPYDSRPSNRVQMGAILSNT